MSKSAGKKGDSPDETWEQNIVIWPEWYEQEVQAEKWASKHVFEDPDGPVYLPRQVRKKMDTMKRVSEIITDTTPVVVNIAAIEEAFQPVKAALPKYPPTPTKTAPATIDEEDSMSMKMPSVYRASRSSMAQSQILKVTEPDTDHSELCVIQELDDACNPLKMSTSLITQSNFNLIECEFMMHVLSCIHYLYTLKMQAGMDEPAPWDNIYPKSKDGLPMYNPSGKYVVKLFWLGTWRKITIDDKIPVDENGKPLFITSSTPNEIWTWLLCKAVLKISNSRYFHD